MPRGGISVKISRGTCCDIGVYYHFDEPPGFVRKGDGFNGIYGSPKRVRSNYDDDSLVFFAKKTFTSDFSGFTQKISHEAR